MENLAEEAVLLEGAGYPGLAPVRDEILRFCTAFRAHMTLEEHSLFPSLLAPSRGQAAGIRSQLMPPLVKLLEDEHQAETGLFVRLWKGASRATSSWRPRSSSAGYSDGVRARTPSPRACA
jgi:hypothetical protein